MINPQVFRDYIVKPSITAIDSYSKAAERLVLGTAMVESLLRYTEQIGGPALGYFQMEPNTHDDIWSHYLGSKKRSYLVDGMRTLGSNIGESRTLKDNPFYAASMCRVHYLRVPKPLPDEDDLEGLAKYWKDHYNTYLGKGTVEGFIKKASIIMKL